MAQEENKISRSFIWRVTLFLLLFALVLVAFRWNSELTAAPTTEDPATL